MDCEKGMKRLPEESIHLIFTSPPYADLRKYAKIPPDHYVEWFLPKAQQIFTILRPDGSFFLNINDRIVQGERHPFVFELALALRREVGFKWIDTLIWVKTNPMPGRRKNKFKDSFEYIFHFAKQENIQFFPERVRQPTKVGTKKRLSRLKGNDFERCYSLTGSGHGVLKTQLNKDNSLPSNVLLLSTETRNRGHPAVFPEKLPAFFIQAFTNEGDIVLDPFSGVATVAKVAKDLNRRFIGFEVVETYFHTGNERLNRINRVHP